MLLPTDNVWRILSTASDNVAFIRTRFVLNIVRLAVLKTKMFLGRIQITTSGILNLNLSV